MIKIVNVSELALNWFESNLTNEVSGTVQAVISDVERNKDSALRYYSEKFEVSSPAYFLIEESDLKSASDNLKKENPEIYDSICHSRDLALAFAKKQRECFIDFELELEEGVFTGQKTIPVETAGVYIPGGRFPLVSTVVMTTSPAIAAGVKNLVLCTPPRIHPDDRAEAEREGLGVLGKPFAGGRPYADERILAAAYICGVKSCYAVGGAQAIAAMAYGTETIPCVDVIVGPGNSYVTSAKKAVFGKVGIDILAGPTEVFIIADSTANPEWLAADMLAQAEHDVAAQAILTVTDVDLAKKVSAEIERQIKLLPEYTAARKSIDEFGCIIIADSFEQAAELANKKAPEHLELAMEEGKFRDSVQNSVFNYGSLFIGHYSAEVFGDYAAGLNHTLPTLRAARYTGGLSVRAFLKTVTTLRTEKDSLGMKKTAATAACLGKAEGLEAHAKAAKIRLEN